MTEEFLQTVLAKAADAPERVRLLIASLTLVGCGDIARDYREGAIQHLLRLPTPEKKK